MYVKRRILIAVPLASALLIIGGGNVRAQSKEFNGLRYQLHQPLGADPSKKYPLVLSLHGAGGGGWPRGLIRKPMQSKHPCFVLVPKTSGTWINPQAKDPQLSEEQIAAYSPRLQRHVRQSLARARGGKAKDLLKVFELVEKIRADFPVDENRVYVIGHSMGGMGSWYAIWERPEMFAAAVPSSGVLPLWKDRKRLVPVPIWAFHGSNDRRVPVEATRLMFDSLKKLGGRMKYTELSGAAHGSSKIAFRFSGDDPKRGYTTQYSSAACDKTPDVWDWLFSQTLANRPDRHR